MKIEKVKAKQLVVSSYSDLSKLSPNVKHIHFRKFVSKKLMKEIVEICPSIERISVSSSAAKRLANCYHALPEKAKIDVSERKSGRPLSIEVF